jgi:hypothetical protein
VGQVPAMGQIQPQNRVARLHEGEIDGHVGLASRMRLHVHVFGVGKYLGGPLPGQVFHHVHPLAPAVIAVAGIALGVFVGHHPALGGHDRQTGEILGGDHFQFFVLALKLVMIRFPNGEIGVFQEINGHGFSLGGGGAAGRRKSEL